MPYTAGTVTVPSSPGTVSVSLPGDPAQVVFQGTNFLPEDTVITSFAWRGLFRGHCGRAFDNPSATYQSSLSVISNHALMRRWQNSKAVTMMVSSGTPAAALYEADCDFVTNGFDLNFTTAASGGYKVVYLAIYNEPEASSMGTVIQSGFSNEDLGFEPRSFINYGGRVGGGTGADSALADQSTGLFSSARWNPDSGGRFSLAGISSHAYPTSTSQQYVNEKYATVNFLGGAAGNFGRSTTFPTFAMNMEMLTWLISGNLFSANIAPADAYAGGIIALSALGECGEITPATSTGGTTTVSGLPFLPGAGLFYGVGDVPLGQSNSGISGTISSCYMLGVVAPGFQWCAMCDFEHFAGSAFQSFGKGFCDRLSGSDVHAATVALTGDGFIATTADDDVSPSVVEWALYGMASPALWIPQIYRRRVAA